MTTPLELLDQMKELNRRREVDEIGAKLIVDYFGCILDDGIVRITRKLNGCSDSRESKELSLS